MNLLAAAVRIRDFALAEPGRRAFEGGLDGVVELTNALKARRGCDLFDR